MKKILVVFFLLMFPVTSGLAESKPAANHLARFWEKLKDGVVQCHLCPRMCVINEGRRGLCTARINHGGELYTLAYGNPVTLNVDPIEKKPFNHVTPGAKAFSIAVSGCNMRCLFCQNWQISQSKPDETGTVYLSPDEVIDKVAASGAPYLAFTYTEPTIFYEYMLDMAKAAGKRGIRCVIHSCGYINEAPLRELLPYITAVNVDVKGFDEEFYRKMGSFASLQPVLDTLKRVKAAGVWLELTCLIIPGQNDDPRMIRRMCVWIRENLGADVPVHFSKFVPAFKLNNLPPTPVEKLEECCRIAAQEGLHYAYIGNVPGHPAENTYCPHCKNLIVGRVGYRIGQVNITGGKCRFCGYKIAGVWE